jgi:hypothetical protein
VVRDAVGFFLAVELLPLLEVPDLPFEEEPEVVFFFTGVAERDEPPECDDFQLS